MGFHFSVIPKVNFDIYWLNHYYNLFRVLLVLAIIFYVYTLGHIKVSYNASSTVSFAIKEGFTTNYSRSDFNESYVKPEEFERYNRQWDLTDFVFIFPSEIQVMTNLVITSNQRMGKCPENPCFRNVTCDKKVPGFCKKGVKKPYGELTGECVTADFPEPFSGNWSIPDVCEIIGWCPVERIIPPLVNYSAVLVDSKYTTLWLKNTVFFPEYKIFVDNLFNKSTEQLYECRHNPITDPYCPVFILGDIIKYTENNNVSFEEIAKFGATIVMKIKWDCNAYEFEKCRPHYSFVRIDDEYSEPASGYTDYRFAYYHDNLTRRTFIRSYRIRLLTSVEASVKRIDWFYFITNLFSYFGLYVIVDTIVCWSIKIFLKNYRVVYSNNLDLYAYKMIRLKKSDRVREDEERIA